MDHDLNILDVIVVQDGVCLTGFGPDSVNPAPASRTPVRLMRYGGFSILQKVQLLLSCVCN